jgi:hypothetical protein
MKRVYWVVIAGVVIIGLVMTGILPRLINRFLPPNTEPLVIPHRGPPYENPTHIQQVMYNPPRKGCFYGICEELPSEANV